MEDPIHEDDEDVMLEQGAPAGGKYPSLNGQNTYEWVSPFEEDAGKIQDQPLQDEPSLKVAAEQPKPIPGASSQQPMPNVAKVVTSNVSRSLVRASLAGRRDDPQDS